MSSHDNLEHSFAVLAQLIHQHLSTIATCYWQCCALGADMDLDLSTFGACTYVSGHHSTMLRCQDIPTY
ncbi:hypothetical protein DAPPUDRAFT_251818 [Daphnia pulex]|uniref:Uncharacterized protein n=1 Tax=Daphnia pulex TaxID=6669 RepID=E9H1E8_DAPPU|nr:hypothetical protein DAPPUDRAFT_251818 [Daphnia pulex]|eukprot:EFX74338.1 hypothetical protein DAPPUDRAFT_251818 [Daphnia pulex]